MGPNTRHEPRKT